MIGDISTIKIKFNFRIILKFVHTYELNLKFRLETSVSTEFIYRTCAIISRGLYIFYPIFKDHFFVFKEVFSENSVLMYELYSRAACNHERL